MYLASFRAMRSMGLISAMLGRRAARCKGNYIGTDKTGALRLGNGNAGVNIFNGASNNTIGGTTAGGNVIAFNSLQGVVVTGATSTGNIRGNAIFSNAGLGIDLGDDGVTPNHYNTSEPVQQPPKLHDHHHRPAGADNDSHNIVRKPAQYDVHYRLLCKHNPELFLLR